MGNWQTFSAILSSLVALVALLTVVFRAGKLATQIDLLKTVILEFKASTQKDFDNVNARIVDLKASTQKDYDSIDARIADLKVSTQKDSDRIDARLEGIETRLDRIEQNFLDHLKEGH